MHRNLDRRVEVLASITNPAHVAEIEGLFDLAFDPGTAAWWLNSGRHLDAAHHRRRRRAADGHAGAPDQRQEPAPSREVSSFVSRKDKKTVLAGGAVVRRVRPDARTRDPDHPPRPLQGLDAAQGQGRGRRVRGGRGGARGARGDRGDDPARVTRWTRSLYPLSSGATKEVRYWSGQPLDVIKRAPDDEVDVVSWLPVKAALHRLTFEHDKELVRQHAGRSRRPRR